MYQVIWSYGHMDQGSSNVSDESGGSDGSCE